MAIPNRRKNPEERRTHQEYRITDHSLQDLPYPVFRTSDPELAKRMMKSNYKKFKSSLQTNAPMRKRNGYWEFIDRRDPKKPGRRKKDIPEKP
ncbi:MAG: hypothetical protein NUV57_06130 [archaeon]|nr:hypothetical protein [archaeon]